mmetsp:Transcript_37748/g.100429  ORF Transcript_37748/g.100429 Transcript_37748/m.100429 type:complete len:199 (-) Transcript_37748:289-885(-)
MFAAELTQTVAEKKKEQKSRNHLASKWIQQEAKLLDRTVEFFKQRAVKEAELQRCDLTVSFELLTRDVADFPTRVVTNSAWVVESWGEHSAESWFYATRGTSAAYTPGPVLFAELLHNMMTKFVDRLKTLGFQTCEREEGTWKVRVSWRDPGDPIGAEKKVDRSPSRSRTLSASRSSGSANLLTGGRKRSRSRKRRAR